MSKKKTVAGTTADPTRKFAKVTVHDVTYSLIFDFNAFAIAETETGVNLLETFANPATLNAKSFRGLLYAALTVAHPDLSIDEVGALITFPTLPLWQAALIEAYQNSMPTPKANENPPEPIATAE